MMEVICELNDCLCVGEDVTVEVLEIRADRVRLAITDINHSPVYREETIFLRSDNDLAEGHCGELETDAAYHFADGPLPDGRWPDGSRPDDGGSLDDGHPVGHVPFNHSKLNESVCFDLLNGDYRYSSVDRVERWKTAIL